MNPFAYVLARYADEQYRYRYNEERPAGFGFVGSLSAQVDVTMSDDSRSDRDCLRESNYRTILADLQTIDERVYSERVGGTLYVAVPLVGPAVDAAQRWLDALADYPVADDEDYAALEAEDLRDLLTDCYRLSDEMADRVARWLFEVRGTTCAGEVRAAHVDEARSAVFGDILDELNLSDDERHSYARAMLADEDDREASLIVSRNPYDPAARAALAPIVSHLRDRGIDPDAATIDEDERVCLVLSWGDARTLSSLN